MVCILEAASELGGGTTREGAWDCHQVDGGASDGRRSCPAFQARRPLRRHRLLRALDASGVFHLMASRLVVRPCWHTLTCA